MSFNQSDKAEVGDACAGAAAPSLSGRLRLQQQPARVESDRQQQQSSGSGEFQPNRRVQPGQLGSSAGPSSRQQ